MKKSFLLLPLVATLAACNKTTPNNDIFTKARARKVPSATKQGVIDRYDDVDMFFTLEETSTVYKKQNGEWVVDGEPAIYTNYYWTVCSLDQDRPACYLASKFDDSYIPYFTVESIEGKAKYSPDTDELTIKNWLNNASASKIFKTVFNSFFSWNASFWSGNTWYLVSSVKDYFMPQAALNAFIGSFEILEYENEGTFDINMNGLGKREYKQSSQFIIRIDEFLMCYEDYLLDSYLCRFTLETIVDNERVVQNYNVRTSESISYSNR